MPATYEPIATNSLTGTTASVTFSSIPSTYTDLVLIFNGSIDTNSRQLVLQFNSDTGTNYSNTRLVGDGTSAASYRATSQTYARCITSTTNNVVSTIIVNIQNYSNTTTNKTILSRGSATSDQADAIVNLWRSTSVINSITCLLSGTGNFNSGSTFTLYGIKAA